MTTLTELYGGGNAPIGSYSFAPSDNPLLTMADDSQWLRAGVAVAVAGYTTAAALSHLRAHRFTRTATQITGPAPAIATNGAGAFVVVASSDVTNVYSSTDNGQTWTARAHNLGGACTPCAVIWTGTRFVIVGNSATLLVRAATSPDGVTWTQSIIATPSAAIAASTVDIAWDGTAVAVVVPGQNTTESVYTSPSGLSGTWTARTLPGGSTPAVGARISGGGLGLIYTQAGGNGTSIGYSTDHGVNWTHGASVLPNSVSTYHRAMVGGSWVAVPMTSQNGVSYSNNFTSWAQVSTNTNYYGVFISPGYGGIWSTHNASSALLTTTDGINWIAQVTADTDATKPLPGASIRMTCVGNASIVSAGYTGTDYLQYAISTPSSANAVGGIPPTSGLLGLWRIK